MINSEKIKPNKQFNILKKENFDLHFDEEYDSKSGKGFKRIIKNFSFLTIGKFGGDFFNFVLFVVLSRVYGQEGIGQYSFAIGFTVFFATLSQFGLSDYTIKEISRNKNSFAYYFQRIFTLNLLQSAIFTIILFSVIPFLSFSYNTKLILAIIGIYQIIVCIIDILTTVFIAYEKMNIAGIVSIMTRIITASGSIIIALMGSSIILSLAFLPIMSFVQLLFVILLIKRIFGEVRIVKSFKVIKDTFKQVKYFGFSDILAQLSSRTDVVLIGFILGETASGIYYIGYRIIFFLLFIPSFASISIFPIVSRLYKQSKIEFNKMYNKSLNMMVIIGLPVSVGIWLIAPQLIETIFGPKFSDSVIPLRLLSGVFVLKCLNSIMSVFLVSSDNQKYVAFSNLILAIFNLIILPVLIYFLKIEGAAIGVLQSSFLLAILFTFKLKSIMGLPNIGHKLLIGFLGVLIFFMLFSIFHSPLYLVIPGSAIIYVGTLLAFKNVRDNEIRMIMDLILRRNTG